MKWTKMCDCKSFCTNIGKTTNMIIVSSARVRGRDDKKEIKILEGISAIHDIHDDIQVCEQFPTNSLNKKLHNDTLFNVDKK